MLASDRREVNCLQFPFYELLDIDFEQVRIFLGLRELFGDRSIAQGVEFR